MRGNPRLPVVLHHWRGSIPAGAGEPVTQRRRERCHGVYPRGCGGTVAAEITMSCPAGLSPRVRGNPRPCCPASTAVRVYPRGCGGTDYLCPPAPVGSGLSPRVRGNRRRSNHRVARAGSIPAGAGEPDKEDRARRYSGVYPRGCGGTLTQRDQWRRSLGLSPRVRGNRFQPPEHPRQPGSIPAGAGEPGAS